MYIRKFKLDFLRNYCAYFYGKAKFGNLDFSIGKSEIGDFSETIAASDLKGSRSRHLLKDV